MVYHVHRKPLFPFIILCISLCYSCTSDLKNQKETVSFSVIRPQKMDIFFPVDFVADIHSLKNVELRARVNGYIEKIWVDEGQFLKKDQLIFSITNQNYREEVLKSRAVLKNAFAEAKSAELSYKNTQVLVEKNVVSPTELEMAQSKLDAMIAKVEEAKSLEATALLNLKYTEIRAPFDGIIDRIPNKVGSLINEGTLLTTISDNNEVFAYFNVTEKQYLDMFTMVELKNATKVQLILANGKEHAHVGRIETIDGEFDKNTGNISFRARFPNPELLLKHGASGKVRLLRALSQVLVIPKKSTFEIQDQVYVYVVDKNNLVTSRAIQVKQVVKNGYIIKSGLSEKDVIVYEGLQSVKEGAVIQKKWMDKFSISDSSLTKN